MSRCWPVASRHFATPAGSARRWICACPADAGTVAFDWFAPYEAGADHAATFWTNVVEWRIERSDDNATLHSFDIEWPSHHPAGLRFRSGTDVGGDRPTLLCTASACTLTP